MQDTSTATITAAREASRAPGPAVEAAASSVSWPAAIAGAFAAASLSAVLLALGSGLGLATLSPWPHAGASAAAFTVAAGIWLIVVQWLSSALGGYLTGRLRTKWVGVHNHEVFFRDTANGFLAWALGTIVTVALFAAAASGLGTTAARNATSFGQTAQIAGTDPAYIVDTLFRSRTPGDEGPDNNATAARGEAARILTVGVRNGALTPEDRGYLSALVANRTGMTQGAAEERVDQTFLQARGADTKVRQAADAARKSAAYFSIFTALAMVVGAFIAAVSGALGGLHRDEWEGALGPRERTAG